MVDDHVSKVEHIGKETVKKLADMRGAAAEVNMGLSVPPGLESITTVGQFLKLAEAAEHNTQLRKMLQVWSSPCKLPCCCQEGQGCLAVCKQQGCEVRLCAACAHTCIHMCALHLHRGRRWCSSCRVRSGRRLQPMLPLPWLRTSGDACGTQTPAPWAPPYRQRRRRGAALLLLGACHSWRLAVGLCSPPSLVACSSATLHVSAARCCARGTGACADALCVWR